MILLIENCWGLGHFFQNFRAYQISYIANVRKLMLIHYMILFSREKYRFQGIRNDEISQCEVSPPNFAMLSEFNVVHPEIIRKTIGFLFISGKIE